MLSAQPANIQLPAPARGSAAIAALNAHLPDVAKAYGLRAQELATLFQSQPSLGVDRHGALLFVCEGLAVPARGRLVDGDGKPGANSNDSAGGMTADSSMMAVASGTAVDAFKLHSLPGVSKVIYLDFDGHTTSGTSWNSSYNGGAPIVSTAFDLDGSPGTFSAEERGMIQHIWQRVAEDYAPFGVDVTTEDPGLEGLRRTSTSDNTYGIRVVISPTNWYNSNAGGVAYINSFNRNSDTPCFVFTQQLANGEKYIAECISHEAGHTVGLYHDGRSGSSPTEYYSGQGNWAPVMGVGYYKSIVQFSKGEYAYANNTEDDLVKIANFVPLAGDDHGNTLASATNLAGPEVATGGTIETRTDADIFRLDTNGGAIVLNIKGPGPDTNLDLKVELLNAGGQLLQTSDSATGFSATINANVSAGTYYLRMSGVGYGDAATTGYSTYGSIGNYIITGTFPTSVLPPSAPVAVATASPASGTAPLTVQFSGANSTDSDGSIVSYHWNFSDGSTGSGITTEKIYTTPDTHSAVLTVVDNSGLTGTSTIPVSVTAAENASPVALITPASTSGVAPFHVTFSGAESADVDGTIISYQWEFGDGTGATGVSPAKIYSIPGSYIARLTVTDDRGATAWATASITVVGATEAGAAVTDFALDTYTAKSGTTVRAAIVVRDRNDRPVSGAAVSLQWSGLVSSQASGYTDASGALIFTSPKSKKKGTVTARITGVTLPPGYTYDPALSVSLERSTPLN